MVNVKIKRVMLFICILSAIIIVFCLKSFDKEIRALRICVDLEHTGSIHATSGADIESVMESFCMLLEQNCGITNVEVEILPSSGSERATAIDRLRVEIMSGSGPDVFLMKCARKNALEPAEALFPIPEKILESGLFLVLDEYMNDAEFMDAENLNPTVMKAGSTDEGQQIIPISYRIPVTCFEKSTVTHSPSKENTWYTLIESNDVDLNSAAAWMDLTESSIYRDYYGPQLEYILGALADYRKEELLFTEEELLQRTQEALALAEQASNGDFQDAHKHYQRFLGVNFNFFPQTTGVDRENAISENTALTMVPLYSDDGGVAASILSYAAINRNTKRPEDAFKVIDYLFSNEIVHNSALHGYFFESKSGIPIQMDLMQQADPMGNGKSIPQYSMTDENFAALSDVRDQITYVSFEGGLSVELERMFIECHELYLQGEDITPAVEKAYKTMKMMMAE